MFRYFVRPWFFVTVVPLAVACDSPERTGTETPIDQCGISCDDGDMCTEDRCDPESGECVHVPREAANACTQDRHCDDQDACTTDTCAVDECGFSRCRHDLIPGCRSCAAFRSCDDGNVCTTDICGADLMCRFVDEPACNPRCRMWGPNFGTPSSPILGDISLWGTAGPRSGVSCASPACECEAALALTDGFGTVPLTGIGNWSCEVSGVCDGAPAADCVPLEHGREYIVWGNATSAVTPFGARQIPVPADASSVDGGGGAPRADTIQPDVSQADVGMPPPTNVSLAVDDYCMAPTDRGVAGTYDATLNLDGAAAITFTVEMQLGQWLHIPPSEGVFEQTLTNELWSNAFSAFTAQIGTRTLRFELYPAKDRLVGPVFDPNMPASAGAGIPEGDAAIPVQPPDSRGARVGTATLVLR